MKTQQSNYTTNDERAGIERCESPLERKLAYAFSDLPLCESPLGGSFLFQWRETNEHRWEVGWWPDWCLVLLAQPEIGPYRADFAISTWMHDKNEPPPFIFIVEVDGHDHHERTKEQAEHDKSRDRFMTAQPLVNMKVFRFTGREVWRDAESCAREVLEYVTKIQYAHLAGEWIKFIKTYKPEGGEQQ